MESFIQEKVQTAGLVQENSQSKESYLGRKRTAHDNHISGKPYTMIKALAQAYTVDYEHLRKMLRNGCTVEDAMKVCRNQIPGKGKLTIDFF